MGLPVIGGSDGAWGTTFTTFLGGADGAGVPTIPNNRIPYLSGGNHTSSANLTFDGTTLTVNTLAVTVDTTLTGDLAINGGDLTSSATTFNLLNATVTTANVLGAATTITFGATTGFTNIRHRLFINDTDNAQQVIGVTINQGANDDEILALKSTDVGHGLTSGGHFATETDTFFSITKSQNDVSAGGASIQAIMEDGLEPTVLNIAAFGGLASTTDTTASAGLINFVCGEHNGVNAMIATPVNANAFTIRATTGAGTVATRLLLKGDDGELHLGNTTLVALDEEDDIGLVRAMQREVSKGVGMKGTPWDGAYGTPVFNYEALRRVGVLGEKDADGNCLFRVQPRFAMNEGAIWQLYCRQEKMREIYEGRIRELEFALARIEGRGN